MLKCYLSKYRYKFWRQSAALTKGFRGTQNLKHLGPGQ